MCKLNFVRQSSEAEEEAITNRLLHKLRAVQVTPALHLASLLCPAHWPTQEECESEKAQRRLRNPPSSDSDRDMLAVELKVLL